MSTLTSKSNRAPWILVAALGCATLCLVAVLVVGVGYLVLGVGRTSPVAARATTTVAGLPANPTAAVIAPASVAPTLSATSAATAAATATPKPTAAPQSTSAGAEQWNIVLAEDFSSNANGWNVADQPYTNEYGTFTETIRSGKLRIEVRAFQGFLFRYRPSILETTCAAAGTCPSYSNVHLTADAQRVSGPEMTSPYGLVFRRDDAGNYYAFEARDDQTWGLQLYKGGKFTTLTDWTKTNAIRPGQVNRLEVTAVGSHFAFAINGTPVGETDDTTIADGYKIGVGFEMGAETDAVFEVSHVELAVAKTGTGLAKPTAAAGPVGGKIAFTSRRDDGRYQIYLMDPDGSHQTRLTDNTFNAYSPVWSPDGKRIGFTADNGSLTDPEWDIYVMNADGSGVTRLVKTTAGSQFGAWSPDGKRIVYSSVTAGQDQIYVMDADASHRSMLTTDGCNYSPTWFPDGKRILYHHNDGTTDDSLHEHPWVMDANGDNATQIGDDEGLAVLSPDGTKIALQDYDDNQIYVMDADGSNATAVTDEGLNNSQLWSPDGKTIAFSSNRSGVYEVYTVNPDGSGLTRVTNRGSDAKPAFPAVWSPDGTKILLVAYTASGATALYSVNVDGSGLKELTSDDNNDHGPAWQPE